MTDIPLTPQQQQIVAHDHGPALVFAVAGAGKSTAAVRRVERLVREGVFAPSEILMCTFNRSAAKDLRDKLRVWRHCNAVTATTLHSVGYRILQRAGRLGFQLGPALNDGDMTDLNATVYRLALVEARARGLDLRAGIDRDDFLDYVSRCKGNLQYGDLDGAALPEAALNTATQAKNPSPISPYLALYRVYEDVRRQAGIITFDDMLVGAWEALLRFPELLWSVQAEYRCVIVDEFQDVNLVQSELLDLITAAHRNYMAIGDDDQTIYEWRGARVEFILGFEGRYSAHKYHIHDNFRSFAPHLTLANAVIAHNKRREPKRLELTRGFGGQTLVHRHTSVEDQARAVVLEIASSLRQGTAADDLVVLLRMYAQTPFIEHFLIEAHIPYVIRGSVPFYQRPEIVVLIAYLRLAEAERRLRSGSALADQALTHAVQDWHRIINRPVRYVPKALADEVALRVARDHLSFTRALHLVAGSQDTALSGRLIQLADVISWLADELTETAASTLLSELDRRTGYTRHLLMLSGLPENAEGRVRNVQAFTRYAERKGSGTMFLGHLEHVSMGGIGRNDADAKGVVTLTTVFRAKGAEWPVVFIPDVNDGTYPMGGDARVEEERRIFYVALTRPTRTLHLHLLTGLATSPFLLQADSEQVLEQTRELQVALGRSPENWTPADARAVLQGVSDLGLGRYLQVWWPSQVEAYHAAAVADRAQRLWAAARDQEVPGSSTWDGTIWEAFGPPATLPGPEDRELIASLGRPVLELREQSAYLVDFEYGQRVSQDLLGEGTVISMRLDGGESLLTIQFDGGQQRTFLKRFARLRPCPAE